MVNVDKIKFLAKKKGIKLKFICQSVGAAESYLGDVRAGRIRMSPDRLAKIAEILHTTPEYLMDETDNPDPPPTALPARFEGLSPEKQALINLIMSIDDPHTLHAIRLLLDEIQEYD